MSSKEEKIEKMKVKVEEIIKQRLAESFNDSKQMNVKVATRDIIKELEKVMNDED